MPGRSGSAPPPSISPSSETSVGPRCEGAGWTTRPAGLSTTARCSSTWTIFSWGPRSVTLRSRLPRPDEDDREEDDAGGDRDVGEVERRPGADFDVVGDRSGAQAVR